MRKQQIIIIFLAFTSIVVFGQKTNEEIEKAAEKALQEWFENPKFDTTSQVDLSIMSELQDSGRSENGLREGVWIIYDIDSSQVGNIINVNVSNESHKMRFEPNIERYVGEFHAGKKEGTWVKYESTIYKFPFWWIKKAQADYKNGLKHGKEILFHGFSSDDLDTLGVIYYKNGTETGEGRLFNTISPYNLKEVYSLTNNGQAFLSKKYYNNGILQTNYVDTIINNKFFLFFTEYYESGVIKSTGYFNDNNIDSIYREFHINGEIFIEEEYQDGKLWNVLTIKNSKGNDKKIGDFKNGNGLLNIYDKKGKKLKTIEYSDGIKLEN